MMTMLRSFCSRLRRRVRLSEFEAAAMERAFFKHDRAANLELASLWLPGVPVEYNPAYLERSKELNAEIEAALVAAREEIHNSKS